MSCKTGQKGPFFGRMPRIQQERYAASLSVGRRVPVALDEARNTFNGLAVKEREDAHDKLFSQGEVAP